MYKVAIYSIMVMGLIVGHGCGTKAYPDEKMGIDKSYSQLFYAIIQTPTFSFKDSVGREKTFTITKIDSILQNKKGGFINPVPLQND